MANLAGISTCFMSLYSKNRGTIDSGASDHMITISKALNHLLHVQIIIYRQAILLNGMQASIYTKQPYFITKPKLIMSYKYG